MIHSTRGESEREKCFLCYLGIEAVRGDCPASRKRETWAGTLCACSGYVEVIESRWPGILIAIFGHTYLALQMQSFSAWRAVVMPPAARENVFQLGDFFETRVANIFHHSLDSSTLTRLAFDENFCVQLSQRRERNYFCFV